MENSKSLGVQPLGDRIFVIEKEVEEVTKGGIIIPSKFNDEHKEGVVAAVGHRQDGSEMGVKPGNRVAYLKHAGFDFNAKGQKCRVLTEAEVFWYTDQ